MAGHPEPVGAKLWQPEMDRGLWGAPRTGKAWRKLIETGDCWRHFEPIVHMVVMVHTPLGHDRISHVWMYENFQTLSEGPRAGLKDSYIGQKLTQPSSLNTTPDVPSKDFSPTSLRETSPPGASWCLLEPPGASWSFLWLPGLWMPPGASWCLLEPPGASCGLEHLEEGRDEPHPSPPP